MSADMQEMRIDLAAALRWAARLGMHEGICNHFSLTVPGAADRFLVNPWGWHWSEITASSLVLCDAQGKVLEGKNQVEDTAFFIHSRIHLKAPHARCVMHTHMPYALALCTVEGGRLEMCEQNAIRFYDRIAYDDSYNGVALSRDEGDRIAASLVNRQVAFLASHGVVVVGPSVALAFDDLYYLERAAQAQVLARSTGLPLRKIDPGVVAETARQMVREQDQAVRHFAALKRILDREEPEYRN